MVNRLYLLLIMSVLLLSSSCSINDFSSTPDYGTENPCLQEVKIHIDDTWSIIDGKVVCIKNDSGYSLSDKISSEINNAVCVYQSRFVLCEDGSCIDLYGSPFERWPYYLYPEIEPEFREGSEWDGTYPVFELIKELYNSCGIRVIMKNAGMDKSPYFIHANNGKVYQFNDPAEQYFEYDDILTADGKIYSEKFPETASWENVVDYRICEDFIIALTSDGKVLTSGIEFSVENAVKINIIYLPSQRIPAVLTSDGKLIFGEIKEDFTNIEGATTEKLQEYYNGLQNTLIQAENFTDIVDFTYIDGNEFVILAQKSDGSLIATTNNIYNPEYVSQPE